MDKDLVQTISTLLVTILLVAFAWFLVIEHAPTDPRAAATADTLGTMIVGAVIARWLQQGAQHQAEKTAEKLQEAVTTAKNGSG